LGELLKITKKLIELRRSFL